jgi:hypothetical protein
MEQPACWEIHFSYIWNLINVRLNNTLTSHYCFNIFNHCTFYFIQTYSFIYWNFTSCSTNVFRYWVGSVFKFNSETNSMDLSLSWESNNSSVRQEIPSILWTLNAYHIVHQSPPLVPSLKQIIPVHAFPTRFLEIWCKIIPSTIPRFPTHLFPSDFSKKTLCIFFSCLIRFLE